MLVLRPPSVMPATRLALHLSRLHLQHAVDSAILELTINEPGLAVAHGVAKRRAAIPEFVIEMFDGVGVHLLRFGLG